MTCTCYILTAHVEKSHTNDDATLASLVGDPLLPMMAVVCTGVSTFHASAPTSGVGGDSSDRGSRMSLIGVVDSFAGLGPFAIPKAHEIHVFSTTAYYNDTKIL